MKKRIIVALNNILLLFFLCSCNIDYKINKSDFFQKRRLQITESAYAKSSINVSKFRKNSIQHTNYGTIVAYYDKDANPVLKLINEDLSEQHTIYLTPKISNQLMGDGHAVISFAVYNDKLYFCYGCHSTKGYYGSFSIQKFFDGSISVSAEKTPIDLTYPQFYIIDGDLYFVYRHGDFIYKDDISFDFSFSKNLCLSCEQGNTVYINELSYEKNLLAIPYVVRLPVLADGYIRNDGIYLFYSFLNKNENHIFGGGYSYNQGLPVYPAQKIIDIGQYNVLMNQESTYIYEGEIWFTFMCRDENNIPQVFIGVTRLADNALIKTYKISKNKTPFSLKGHGTLSLPLSRAQVLVSNDYIHVIYRENENIWISSCKKEELSNDNFIRTLVCSKMKNWEPSIDTDYFRKYNKILFFVQTSEQEDYDTISESTNVASGVPLMLYEFSELNL